MRPPVHMKTTTRAHSALPITLWITCCGQIAGVVIINCVLVPGSVEPIYNIYCGFHQKTRNTRTAAQCVAFALPLLFRKKYTRPNAYTQTHWQTQATKKQVSQLLIQERGEIKPLEREGPILNKAAQPKVRRNNKAYSDIHRDLIIQNGYI